MTSYATLPQLKNYLDDDEDVDDDLMTDVLESVSREIDDHCHRSFDKDTEASARLYPVDGGPVAWVHDFWSISGLVIETDAAGDGGFATVWQPTGYQLEPLNGIVDGLKGFPYYKLRAQGGACFPACDDGRARLRVTAQWGWAAVPAPVYQSTLILAAETHKLKDSPFGVGGYGEWGIVKVRDNPMAARKLKPYRRDPLLVA